MALILALQPVSAAFNPVVTLVERASGLVDTPTAAPSSPLSASAAASVLSSRT